MVDIKNEFNYTNVGDYGMREIILKILKENQGQYVSGEMLAVDSGITRAGIWKHINQLREIGYSIDSSPRKGYRLVSLTPAVTALEIKDGLDTVTFGQVVYQQTKVDSTNCWAKLIANQGAAEGTLVIAENQTAGKGRMGRHWSSAEGLGLWFSLILRPQVSASVLAGITLLTAVTMTRVIKNITGIQVQIKWPNDLLYDGRKLVGILAEISGEMDLVNYLILGIGVNVNHTLYDFPPELNNQAVSLKMIRPRPISRKTILQEFLKNFEAAYYALPETGMAEFVAYARQHSATLGKVVKLSQGFGRILEGEAIDLDLDGSLIIKETNANLVRIYSGDLIETSELNN